MNKKITFSSLWLGTLILAYYAGNNQTTEISTTDKISVKEEAKNKHKKTNLTQTKGSKEKRTVKTTRKPQLKTASSAMTESLDLLNQSSHYLDFAKMATVYQNFKMLSDSELEKAFLYRDDIKNANARSTYQAMLYSLWAERDPIAALAHNKENSSYATAWTQNTIISVWAKQDPSSAYDWFQNKKEENPLSNNRYNSFLQPIFAEFAKDDLNQALEKLSESSGRDKDKSFRGILEAIDNPEQYKNLIDKFSSTDDKSLVKMTIDKWAKDEPLSVIEWSQNLEDTKAAQAYEKKARDTWIKSDPEEATEWILSNTEEGQENTAVTEIIRAWNWRDSKSLSQWLTDYQGEGVNDKTYSFVAQRLSREDPYKAADWANKITDSKQKVSTLRNIYSRSSRRNKDAATDLIQALPSLTEEELKQIIK